MTQSVFEVGWSPGPVWAGKENFGPARNLVYGIKCIYNQFHREFIAGGRR
jgi:hypothetical protein